MTWRYIAQSLPDGAFVDWDLPLADVQITRTLSGPGRLTGTIPVEVARLVGLDGHPVLKPWGTAVWAEADGQIRGGGILTPLDLDGPRLSVDCVGFSGYPQGMPWTADRYAGFQVDPLEVVRRIWAHLQAQPAGNLGVVVDATVSTARAGVAEYWTDAAGNVVRTAPDYWVDASGKQVPAPEYWVNGNGVRVEEPDFWRIDPGTPFAAPDWWENGDGVQVPAPNFWVDGDGDVVPAPADPTKPPAKWRQYTEAKPPAGWKHYTRTAPDYWVDANGTPKRAPTGAAPAGWKHYTATNPPPTWRRFTAKTPPPGWKHYTTKKPPTGWKHYTRKKLPKDWTYHEAEPVELVWWATHDLGAVIDDLADAAPFDYLEHTRWAGDRLAHRLQLGYPTIGTRRHDLRFAIGENVTVVPALSADDDDYASDVLALGAGEGKAMVRAELHRDGPGLRRVAVYTDKTARTKTALTNAARRELAWLTGQGRLTTLTVADHPHARLGSFDVGDEIRVVGRAGWVDLDTWGRVVELVIEPEASDRMTVTVQEV
ncbi:hypothetical protein [Cellulosimicrobium cellulans]|uniref:hypothetical protein n=1 Tax=Cellulosimicrobium cellulans TaxID=1710 RepID=UPI001BA49108|nr:hypothetical protein [Cellulosimicrobium cellulans]QUC01228.1 hypothetical protein J5A69_08725 [Cellulosimicrobium cellulans]